APARLDVWSATDGKNLVDHSANPGALVLFPGDRGGGEFSVNSDVIHRCTEFFVRLEEEFDVSLIDLSAGRSHAIDMALAATARKPLRHTVSRWMVYHRWTKQHIVAAAGLTRPPKVARDTNDSAMTDRVNAIPPSVPTPVFVISRQHKPNGPLSLRVLAVPVAPPGGHHSANASIGGQAQTRLRSPLAPSIRRT
ncbi:hypothetical protein ACFQ1S_43220, partial [Kibdelosporangium lantanae]